MPTNLIFVYGTLRKNVSPNQHALLAEHAEYIADGTIQAKLFDVGHYPAISESSNRKHQVSGELYKLHNSKESQGSGLTFDIQKRKPRVRPYI